MGGYAIQAINPVLPLQAECSLPMLTWMELALLLKPYILNPNDKNVLLPLKRNEEIACLSGALIIAVAIGLMNATVEVRINYYGIYPLYLMGAGLFIILILSCAKKIGKNKILEYVGRNTMQILLFHKFSILFFQSVFGPTKRRLRNLDTIEGTVCALCVATITIVGCLALNEGYRYIRNLVTKRYNRRWKAGLK